MADFKYIFAVIDIGSNYIKGIVAEQKRGQIYVLANTIKQSDGIIDGIIDNEDKVVVIIKNVVKDLKDKLGEEFNKVVISVPAHNVSLVKLYGETYIVNETGRIKSDDLQRVIVEATKSYNVEGQEIINIIPLRYNIDGYESLTCINKTASKFGAEVLALHSPNSIVYPYLSVLEKANLEIIDICLSPFADQYELLNNVSNDRNVVTMNIGFSTTSISIIVDGALKGIGTFNVGLKRIVSALVDEYEIHPVEAYDLIMEYGVLDVFREDIIKVKSTQENIIEIKLAELSNHINHLALSMLITLKKEIDKYGEDLFNEVIITGGCLKLSGFEVICDKVFEGKARLYEPNYIGARNPAYSTTFGLVRYIVDKLENRKRVESSLSFETQKALSTPKKKVLNLKEDSVIGKLFDYFFE